jgi:hypothetical protein
MTTMRPAESIRLMRIEDSELWNDRSGCRGFHRDGPPRKRLDFKKQQSLEETACSPDLLQPLLFAEQNKPNQNPHTLMAKSPSPTERTLPCYGSLQNKSTGEYRMDRATHMTAEFEMPKALFRFESQGGGRIYAIRSVKTNEYFQDTIHTMAKEVKNDKQRWHFEPVPETSDMEFYIRNKENNKYMTKNAGELVKKDSEKGIPGTDEIFKVSAHCI